MMQMPPAVSPFENECHVLFNDEIYKSKLQVVLSASVCTRQGKALVSRQFVEMNRLRVEGLLAAFPKLVGHAKQHTYVETDTVRYVYQPLENQMYLLLITTKASNIVEDLMTLRLLAKVVPDVCGGLMEHSINEHAFDLIFAFDEVLTAGGYKEEATLSVIRTNLLMDSHEEKIHMALKASKEIQAQDIMRQQVKKIHDQQISQMRQNFVQGGGGAPIVGGMQGFGGGGGRPGQSGLGMFDFNAQQQAQENVGASSNPYGNVYAQPAAAAPEAPKVLAKSGMKLGGVGVGGKKDSLMAAMAAEDNLFPMAGALGGKKAAPAAGAFDLGAAVPKHAAAIPSTPVTLVLEEKIGVSMNREGGVESCDVKGMLNLTANTDAGVPALVAVNKASFPSTFTVSTHPKVDKKFYEQNGLLQLKGGKGFPVGRAVGILRWSYNGEDAAPLTINCWPEDEGAGTINVNIEMELTRTDVTLYDVNILLPLGTTEPPSVNEIDGVYKHDPRNGMMCWHFDQVDANHSATASMEFSIPGSDTDAFFPIQIGFRSETLLCPIQITGVTNAGTGAPIPNQITKIFVPENYQCA
jgi:coatomer subunit delta